MEKYESILHAAPFEPKRHPRMSAEKRAAQFSPYAALSGYGEEIAEAGRETADFIQPEGEHEAEINRALSTLQAHAGPPIRLAVTYFIPDGRKSGGRYQTARGAYVKTDAYARRLFVKDDDGNILTMDFDRITEITLQEEG